MDRQNRNFIVYISGRGVRQQETETNIFSAKCQARPAG